MHGRMRRSLTLLVLALSVLAAALLIDDDGSRTARARDRVLPTPSVRRVLLLGHSVEGRPIRALMLGDPGAAAITLVFGCIHGNETAGIAVADLLSRWHPPPRVALWVVGDLNPDGVAAGTRQNAHRVDLNRNFPFHWRPLGPPGVQQYAGPRPLSEPESRIAYALIRQLRPRLTIWFHQPLGITDRSGGDVSIERRFARLSGLPLRQLPRYPGSATWWQDFRVRSGTAFVVELPPGRPSRSAVARYARSVEKLTRP
jgi:murein peptide amidase A